MPASEYAYGEGHPATFDIEPNHKVRSRRLARVGQLSEIAHGPGDIDEKQVTFLMSEPEHDYNPDN